MSFFDYSDTYSGSNSDTDSYNVWTGVKELMENNAKVLAYFVAIWSGIWPYAKLFILCLGIIIYRNGRLPAVFEWLSTIAHFSFLDVWMVVIAAVAVRYSYSGEEEKVCGPCAWCDFVPTHTRSIPTEQGGDIRD